MTALVTLAGPHGIVATLCAVPIDAARVRVELRVDAPGLPLRVEDFGEEPAADPRGELLALAEALRDAWGALGFIERAASIN
jgi:hypothetical protein